MAVQAGGACGIWPARLAASFAKVMTIEPLADNFQCLAWNIEGECNANRRIIAVNGVLGSGEEGTFVGMKQHPREEHNAGSQQVELLPLEINDNTTMYTVHTIDGLCSPYDVSLICLDLEGYELQALKGAFTTIDRCEPVIVVEDKGLSEKFGTRKGDVVRYLMDEHDYVIAQQLKRDVIMVPGRPV